MSPSSFVLRRLCSCSAISRPLIVLAAALFLGVAVFAKEAPLNAILLYDAEKGPAYVQVTDLLINGKTELRACTAGQRIDRSAYGKSTKLSKTGRN